MPDEGRAHLLAKKVITTFFRRMVVVTKDVDRAAVERSADIDAEIRVLNPGEVSDYITFKPFQDRSEVEQRLAAGHQCFAAWYEGRIVHAGWSATGRAHIPYIHSDVVLGPRDFYIYDSYTIPEFRRAKLVMARSSAMHAHYSHRGFEKSYGVIAMMNQPGLSVLEPSGYRRIGMYGCVRMGPLHYTWAYLDPIEALPRLAAHERAS